MAGIYIEVFNTFDFWRFKVDWNRHALRVYWCSKWGKVNARGDLGWTEWKPILKLGAKTWD